VKILVYQNLQLLNRKIAKTYIYIRHPKQLLASLLSRYFLEAHYISFKFVQTKCRDKRKGRYSP